MFGIYQCSLFTSMHWRRKWQPTPVFFPGESQGWGCVVGWCLWGRTSQTQLTRLSSRSSSVLPCVYPHLLAKMGSSEEAYGQVDITPILIYKEPYCGCILVKVLWTLRMRKVLSHIWAGLSSFSSLSWGICPQGTKSSCRAWSPFSSYLMFISSSTRDDSKCGHLMWRVESLEKTLMLRKIEGRRRRGWQKMRWLDGITDSIDISLSKAPRDGEGQGSLGCCSPWGRKELAWLSDWTTTCIFLEGLHPVT